MSSTIKIKRSVTTATPGSLAQGELAYSANNASDSLFIGYPGSGNVTRIGGGKYPYLHQANTTAPGTTTANSVVITNGNNFVTAINANKIIVGGDDATANITSYSAFSNTTQLGNTAGGSNTEILSSWAIKNYVDTAVSTELDQLNDVTITSVANNDLLVYDLAAGQWENHTLSGTANEVEINRSSHNITIGLPDNVTVTANLTVSQSLGVTNTAQFSNSVTIDGQLNQNYNVNVTGVANVSSQLNVGANVNLSTTQINVGNSTVNTAISSSGIDTDGTLQVLGAANVGSIHVVANAVVQGATMLVGTLQAGNTTITGDLTPTTNVAYDIGSVAKNWRTVYANTTISQYLTVDHDLTVSGNLYVTGTLATINVETISVTDSLIQLSSNNISSDTIDIGFYGNYNTGGGANEFAGLFRDASDGVFKVFVGLQAAPTTTVDTANATFAIGTLQAFLQSGGLISNTANVSITANSSLGVNFVANTLTLSTSLGTASGGLGVSSFTSNGVFYSSNTSAVAFATGTEGDVLQLTSGVPSFGQLDGGSF